jgi:immune inhibitor A
VTYWNERQEDNNTSKHPGEGLILPVDARPKPIRWDNGSTLNLRAQTFDATFGPEATDPLSLSREVRNGRRVQILSADVPKQAPVTVFDDSKPNAYWDASLPNNSVKVAGYGVRLEITGQSADKQQMTVVVQPVTKKQAAKKK